MTTQIHRIHCVSVYWFSNIAFISFFKKINRNAHGWCNDWKCTYKFRKIVVSFWNTMIVQCAGWYIHCIKDQHRKLTNKPWWTWLRKVFVLKSKFIISITYMSVHPKSLTYFIITTRHHHKEDIYSHLLL